MDSGLVASRYATAFLEYVLEKDMGEEAYEKAKLVSAVFTEVKELQDILDNPLVPKEKKRQLILTASGGDDSPAFQNVVGLLLRNNRENYLHSIMLMFQELYYTSQNVYKAKLITAVEVDEPTIKNLTTTLESKLDRGLDLEKIVDPDILGGFILEIDYNRWDASLRGQLNKIKRQYIEKNRRIV